MGQSHEKLFQRMLQTKAGWKLRDLEKLYFGYGFEKRVGKRHFIYYHPIHPTLNATVPRSGELLKAYVSDAIQRIRQLEILEGSKNEH